jgi:calcineurin-like phosphoesterase family protein
MNKIYLTSDLHFCHNKDFIYQPRGFNSVQEMNETIIKNFYEVMDYADKLYILGDCFLNNNEEGMKFMKRLPGKKYIIWGNHDNDSRKMLLEDAGFICLGYASILKWCNGYTFYLSHYPTLTSNSDEDKPLKRRIINLCGHTHTKDKFHDMDKGLIYHVELDAHDNKPILIDDIITDIKRSNYEAQNRF